MKKQATSRKKIANHISSKRLMSQIYRYIRYIENSQNSVVKKQVIQLENEPKTLMFNIVKVQIKITMRYHHIYFEMAKIKSSDNTK